ncbi:MAG: hypothetical protein OEL20_05260 [Sulfuritalea sp.]|nr:hypothetical protein [Sulfuritalea sp.]
MTQAGRTYGKLRLVEGGGQWEMSVPFGAGTVELGTGEGSTVADEILAAATWLASKRMLHRTVRMEDLSPSEQRIAHFFAERYGILGEECARLQSIGDRYGLTRERIRQVQAMMSERAGGAQFVAPRLLELAEAVKQNVPIAVSDFDTRYRKLLGMALSVEGASRFAREVLGRNVATFNDAPAAPVGQSILRILVDPEADTGDVRAVREATRRMVRSCGAAHVLFVAGAASEIAGHGISVEDTRNALKALNGMEWLVEAEGWYWLGPDAPNRAHSVARKMFAATDGRLDIEDIHSALCRSRRFIYEDDRVSAYPIEAPWRVIREVLSRTPWLETVQRNDFRAKIAIDPKEELSDAENAILPLLKENGGVIAKFVILSRLIKTNLMEPIAAQLMLARTPICYSPCHGVYVLRGYPFTGAALAAAQAVVGGRQATAVATDQDGAVVFDVVATDYALRNSMIDIPASVARTLPVGPYQASGLVSGEVKLGAVASAVGRVSHLARLLRNAGVKANDTLRFTVNAASKDMHVALAPSEPNHGH